MKFAPYTSGRLKQLKVGITSYSENKTSLEVVGGVSIGGSITGNITGNVNATSGLSTFTNLNVTGVSTFGGNVAIGTDNVTDPVGVGNTSVLAVGILTAYRLYSTVFGEFTGGSVVADNIVGSALSVSGISTLGFVKISSGIITATSGVVTYFGDGSGLTGVGATEDVKTNSLQVLGISTFTGDLDVNGNIIGDSATNISGINSVTATNFFGSLTGNVTGDLTGNADTATSSAIVTDAAQPNITSLGSLTGLNVVGITTVGGDIKANGNIVGDNSTNITGIAGVTATTLAGTLQTAAQPNITSLGTLTSLNVSGDVSIGGTLTYDDVTNIDSVGLITARSGINVTGGGLNVVGVTTFNNSDVIFQGAAASQNITFDASENDLEFSDLARAKFGDNDDLEIWHGTGNDSHIKNSTNDLKIRSDSLILKREDDSEPYLKATVNSDVKIYYNGNEKFATTGVGVTVTGDVDASGSLIVLGSVGIGTTDPNAIVNSNNTSKLAVGILTARQIFSSLHGEFTGGTVVAGSIVGTALSISGISTFGGNVAIGTDNVTDPVGVGNTAILAVGILTARRIFSSLHGEFTGGTVVADNIVGTALSISGISTLGGNVAIGTDNVTDPVGASNTAILAVGILTARRIFSSLHGEFTGGSVIADNIVGSALSISGISTIGIVQISSGIITATSGIVTYFGDGSNLTNVSGSVAGINTAATSNFEKIVVNDLVVGSGASVVGIVTASAFTGFKYLQAPFGSTTTFTVTVAAKSGHRYQGQGSGNAYLINGVQAPVLTLTPGRTYRFTNDNTGSHPLKFYYEADKTTEYTTGVSFQNTYTEITVSDTTPNVLHYQCTAHAYMGNAVVTNSNVVDTTYTGIFRKGLNVTGVSTFGSTVNIDDGEAINFAGGLGQIKRTAVDGFTIESSGSNNVHIEANGGGGTAGDIVLQSSGTTIVEVPGDKSGVIVTGILTATDFSGNISGVGATFTNITGTLQTAAQPNITSVGTLTSLNVTGDVSIGGTLTYDDVTNIDSVGLITARSGVRVSAGGLTVSGISTFNDNINVTGVSTFVGIATFQRVDINQGTIDGTNIGFNHRANAQFLSVDASTTLGVTGQTTLGDVNVTGVSTFNDNVHLLDNDKLLLGGSTGTHDGLEVYHDSNHSYVNDTGTGNLYIGGNQVWINDPSQVKVSAVFNPTSYSALYYDNQQKLQTTGVGVTVFGTTQTQTLNVSGISTFVGITSFKEDVTFETANGNNIHFDKSANSVRFGTNVKLMMGNSGGQDLNIFHNTINTIIGQNTIPLIFDTDNTIFGSYAGDRQIEIKNGGSVDLYHNNVFKLSTVGYGVSIAGITSTTHLNVTGVSTFAGLVNINGNLQAAGNVTLGDGTGDNIDVQGRFVRELVPSSNGDKDLGTSSFRWGTLHVKNILQSGGGISTFTNDINANGNIIGDNATNILGISSVTATNFFGTLQTAAQPNITSVGTLGALTVSGISTLGVTSTTNLETQTLNVTGISTIQQLNVTGTSTFAGNLDIADTIYHTGDSNTKIRFPATDTITFHTSGAERLRINSIGDVNISGTTTTGNLSVSGIATIGQLYVTGITTLAGNINANGNIVGDNATNISGINSVTATTYFGDGTKLTGISTSGDIINQTGITTSIGTFNVSAGIATNIDSFAYASNNYKTAEYTIHFMNGSKTQAQKLLVMQDGATAFSNEFAVMSSSNLLISVGATVSGSNVLIQATPETGVSGVTTFRWRREVQD